MCQKSFSQFFLAYFFNIVLFLCFPIFFQLNYWNLKSIKCWGKSHIPQSFCPLQWLNSISHQKFTLRHLNPFRGSKQFKQPCTLIWLLSAGRVLISPVTQNASQFSVLLVGVQKIASSILGDLEFIYFISIHFFF